MTALDPRTVILLCGLMGGLMALVLHSLRRNYPRSILGLGEWAWGMFAWFLSGVAMVTLQNRVPAVLSITLPNLLVLVGAWQFLLGTQRFLHRAPTLLSHRLHAFLVGAVTLGVLWFTAVMPSYGGRIVLMAAALGYLFAAHAWLVLRHGGRRFSSRLVALVLLALAANHAVRLGTALWLPPGDGLFDKLPQNTVYITTLPLLVLMLAIGLVLMAGDRLSDELNRLASHDALTQALSRRTVTEAFAVALAVSARQHRPVAALYMDLDHFKAVNDTFGHAAGDRLLARFAECARSVLRDSDRLGRLGGEEFVALLPDTDLAAARGVAERVRSAWEREPGPPRSTVSIGIACNTPGDTVEALLNRADAALYRAKAAGRNRAEG
jgi:diguanylate cyclase (GGDEF)-like protein